MQQAEAISSFDAKMFAGEGVMLRRTNAGVLHHSHSNSTLFFTRRCSSHAIWNVFLNFFDRQLPVNLPVSSTEWDAIIIMRFLFY